MNFSELRDLCRHRLLEYAERVGIEFHRSGKRWLARCPFHPDRNPSFSVFIGRNGLPRIICSCGWQGDVFDLAIAMGRASGFKEALDDVAAVLGLPVVGARTVAQTPSRHPRGRRTPPRRPQSEPIVLPADFEERHRRARWRLWSSPRLLAKVADELGVPVEVVRSLCYTTDALGWASGRLVYLYETGAKLRNLPGRKPRFRWIVGKASRPWRWHFAAREEVRRIYICEGESDCVAAVAAGLEELHPRGGGVGAAVVASPGTSFPLEWAELFQGKEALLLFDLDQAGTTAAEKVAGLLKPFARSVRVAGKEGAR
ncbi:CHC2 zinc finger domain-containing protein [Haloferula sp. A504]|uniref:CHC2 zinc finger domain-containing protein n=1 Tax=Haloferula sp. A504 TaxID=3373601 RepID=UPI0031BED1B1|nr:CHC2 zinc finger domain-containing protein [Verrucomicrobiaceae bacterium E54]